MDISFIKKRKFRIGFIVLFISLFSFLCINSIYAQVSGDTPVAYSKEESDSYALSITVKGDGELQSKIGSIRNDTKIYMLMIDESIEFQIRPDKDGEIKSVRLNEQDVTSKVKDNKIIVNGAERNQKLNVEFLSTSKNSMNSPKTGDTFKTGMYIVLVAISLITIICLFFTRKKKHDETSDEREDGKDVE